MSTLHAKTTKSKTSVRKPKSKKVKVPLASWLQQLNVMCESIFKQKLDHLMEFIASKQSQLSLQDLKSMASEVMQFDLHVVNDTREDVVPSAEADAEANAKAKVDTEAAKQVQPTEAATEATAECAGSTKEVVDTTTKSNKQDEATPPATDTSESSEKPKTTKTKPRRKNTQKGQNYQLFGCYMFK